MIAVECRMQSGYLDRMGTDLDEALAIVKEACANMEAVSAASPNRETAAMRDGSDAVADWSFLNALLSTASGAIWVSIHHGGGVGIGFSQHAGMVAVCGGTRNATRRLGCVLTNDPASGVMRHADAGYQEAITCAREHGLNLPMIDGAG